MSESIRKVATAGTMNDYGPRFEKGEHTVVLLGLELKNVWNKKENRSLDMIAAEVVIISSDTMKKGTRVSDAFMIGRVGAAGETQAKKAGGLVRAAIESLGHKQKPEDTDGKLYQELIVTQLTKMCELDTNGQSKRSGRVYPGRGIVLRVLTRESRPDRDGKVYNNNTYEPIAQTLEQVAAARKQIEAASAAALAAAASGKSEAPSAPAPAAQPEAPAAKPEPTPAPYPSGNMLDGIDF